MVRFDTANATRLFFAISWAFNLSSSAPLTLWEWRLAQNPRERGTATSILWRGGSTSFGGWRGWYVRLCRFGSIVYALPTRGTPKTPLSRVKGEMTNGLTREAHAGARARLVRNFSWLRTSLNLRTR
jgi:hypothetical protein